MQYLITTFTDSTGIPHNHVTKARENQTFTVVEAESEKQAMKIYEEDKMIKRILKIWFTIAMYELGKYVTEQLIVWWQSDDELDAPLDFTDADHAHLNRLMREVSK